MEGNKKQRQKKTNNGKVVVERPRRSVRLQAKTPTQKQKSKEEDIEDIVKWGFSGDETQKIRESLLEWYDHNKRDLPWRYTNTAESEEEETKRAYGVWVSEVMLQQTRVQTVIQYYNRWMEKWPTLQHLSLASLEEVNEMWAGLGYYRRARFLLEGARMIVAKGSGFPKTVSALQKIQGIGDYTAGAIASIAFKEVVPVVDGNVIRVIARLRAISANPKESVTVKKLWKLAAQLVDPIRPGDFNQALMELGATVCTSLNPSCISCPASGHCRALSIFRHDSLVLVTDFPLKGVRVKQRQDFSAVCVVELLGGQRTSEGSQIDSREVLGGLEKIEGRQTNNRFLLVKRPDDGLLAGLWEFPSVLLDGEADLTTRREVIDHFLKNNFGLDTKQTCDIAFRKNVGEFVHIFSHIRLKIYVELLVLDLKGGGNHLSGIQDKATMTWKYVDGKALSSMGLTSSVRKVYTMVQELKQEKLSFSLTPSKKRSRTTRKKNNKSLN
ncbi:hypothetical protein CMV_005350 [Castanea mollissima]|uniref:Adenine DNA glycosylase n=1 Tax=Castanea mollissima TaxID=60419 RepID=A0A8J4W4D0_9ROSI|nr:hypothetical protein CMV_005350 [Castanea mollissima]